MFSIVFTFFTGFWYILYLITQRLKVILPILKDFFEVVYRKSYTLCRRLTGFTWMNPIDDVPMQVEIVEEASDTDNDEVNQRVSVRVYTTEEINRRQAERRLIRENSPLSNLEAITQRLGREAAERFRLMIEERKQQTNARVNSRVDITYLRAFIEESDLETVESKHSVSIKTIVHWYGALGGILIIRLKNMNNRKIEADYK